MDDNRYEDYCFGNFPAGEETVSIITIMSFKQRIDHSNFLCVNLHGGLFCTRKLRSYCVLFSGYVKNIAKENDLVMIIHAQKYPIISGWFYPSKCFKYH